MFAEFKGRSVKTYQNTRQIIRTFNMPKDVVGVQVSGSDDDIGHATVAITMVDGKTWLYNGFAQLIRRG